jgi:hypothetical protein
MQATRLNNRFFALKDNDPKDNCSPLRAELLCARQRELVLITISVPVPSLPQPPFAAFAAPMFLPFAGSLPPLLKIVR